MRHTSSVSIGKPSLSAGGAINTDIQLFATVL